MKNKQRPYPFLKQNQATAKQQPLKIFRAQPVDLKGRCL